MSNETAATCLHCSAPVEPGAVVCERAECIGADDRPRIIVVDDPRPDLASRSAPCCPLRPDDSR